MINDHVQAKLSKHSVLVNNLNTMSITSVFCHCHLTGQTESTATN